MFTTADIAAAVLAYLIGSLSFAVIVSRALGLPDPHSYGSGNPGATNVLRSGSKKAALLTLLGDTLKGVAAVLLAKAFATQFGITVNGIALVAVTVFLGHLFPVFFGFKGGKGVATFLGLFLALDWQVGLALCLTWLVTALATRYSSVAALFAAASAGLWIVWWTDGSLLVLALILTVQVYVRHSANLTRLKAGTEPRIGQKKP